MHSFLRPIVTHVAWSVCMSVCLSIEMPSGGVEPWIICQFGAGFPTGRGSFGESSIGHAHTHAVDIFNLIRKGQERCGLQPPVL